MANSKPDPWKALGVAVLVAFLGAVALYTIITVLSDFAEREIAAKAEFRTQHYEPTLCQNVSAHYGNYLREVYECCHTPYHVCYELEAK